MKYRTSILVCLLVAFCFIRCVKNNTSSTQQTEASKYDRTPFAVYVYDGNKEIVLYENPNTATVNGKSGSWTTSHYGRIYEAYGGRRGPTVYVVDYGNETLVISPGEELVFFGTEKQAEANEDKKYNWKECEKKRL